VLKVVKKNIITPVKYDRSSHLMSETEVG